MLSLSAWVAHQGWRNALLLALRLRWKLRPSQGSLPLSGHQIGKPSQQNPRALATIVFAAVADLDPLVSSSNSDPSRLSLMVTSVPISCADRPHECTVRTVSVKDWTSAGYMTIAGGLFGLAGGFGGALVTDGRGSVTVFRLFIPLFTTLDPGTSVSVSMADSASVSLAWTGSFVLPLLFFFLHFASKTESLSHQLGVSTVRYWRLPSMVWQSVHFSFSWATVMTVGLQGWVSPSCWSSWPTF